MDAPSLPSEVAVEAAAAEDARDSDTFRISSEQNEAPAQVGHSGTNGAPKGAMDSGNGAKVEGLERGQEPSQKEDWPSIRGSTAPARAFSLRSRARRFWNQILTWKVCGSPWRVHWITWLHSKVSQETHTDKELQIQNADTHCMQCAEWCGFQFGLFLSKSVFAQ